MARYFFNVDYGASCSDDPEGEEFDSPAAALTEARAVACELLAESIRCDSQTAPRRVVVCDAASHEIGSVALRDVVPPAIL